MHLPNIPLWSHQFWRLQLDTWMWWLNGKGAEDEKAHVQTAQMLDWLKTVCWHVWPSEGYYKDLQKHCTYWSCTHVRRTSLHNCSESTGLFAAYHHICALIQCRLSYSLSFQHCTLFYLFFTLRFLFFIWHRLAGLSSHPKRIISIATKNNLYIIYWWLHGSCSV